MRGFTLIEVLISMVILSFIALAIYQNTSQSFILRDRLEQDNDFYNSLRVALDVLSRDITQIYTPISSAFPGNIGKADIVEPGTGTVSNFGSDQKFWGTPINSQGVRPSRFQGESNSIQFVANSHVRVFQESKECELSKITYSIEESSKGEKGAAALVKRENIHVFDSEEDKEKDTTYTLLTNVKAIKFQYLDGAKDTWHNKWDTAGSDHNGIYPSVIELEIEVYLPASSGSDPNDYTKRTTFKLKQRFKPEIAA